MRTTLLPGVLDLPQGGDCDRISAEIILEMFCCSWRPLRWRNGGH